MQRPLHLTLSNGGENSQSGPWRGKLKPAAREDYSVSPPPPPPPRFRNIVRQDYSQSPPPPPPSLPSKQTFVFAEPVRDHADHQNSVSEQDDQTVKSVTDLVNQFESKIANAAKKKHNLCPVKTLSQSPTDTSDRDTPSTSETLFDFEDDVTSLTVSEKTKLFEQFAYQEKERSSNPGKMSVPQFQTKFVHAALRSKLGAQGYSMPPLQQQILSMQTMKDSAINESFSTSEAVVATTGSRFPIIANTAYNHMQRDFYNRSYSPLSSTLQPSSNVVVDIESPLKKQLTKSHYDRLFQNSRRDVVDDDISSITMPTIPEEGIGKSATSTSRGRQRYRSFYKYEPARGKPCNPYASSPNSENSSNNPCDPYTGSPVNGKNNKYIGGDELDRMVTVMAYATSFRERHHKSQLSIRKEEEQTSTSTLLRYEADASNTAKVSRQRNSSPPLSNAPSSDFVVNNQEKMQSNGESCSAPLTKATRKTLFIVPSSDSVPEESTQNEGKRCPASPAPSDENTDNVNSCDAPSDENRMGNSSRGVEGTGETTNNFAPRTSIQENATTSRNTKQSVTFGRGGRVSLVDKRKSFEKTDAASKKKIEEVPTSNFTQNTKRQVRSIPVESTIRSKIQTFEENDSISRLRTGLPPRNPRFVFNDEIDAQDRVSSDKLRRSDTLKQQGETRQTLPSKMKLPQQPPNEPFKSLGQNIDESHRDSPPTPSDIDLNLRNKIRSQELLQSRHQKLCSEGSTTLHQSSAQCETKSEAMDSANVSEVVRYTMSETKPEKSRSSLPKRKQNKVKQAIESNKKEQETGPCSKREIETKRSIENDDVVRHSFKSNKKEQETSISSKREIETKRCIETADDVDDEICSITMRITRDSRAGPSQVGVSISEYGKGSVEVSRLDTPTCQKVAQLVLGKSSEISLSETKQSICDVAANKIGNPGKDSQGGNLNLKPPASQAAKLEDVCDDRRPNPKDESLEDTKLKNNHKSYPWRKPGENLIVKSLGGISAVKVGSITPLQEQNLTNHKDLGHSAFGKMPPMTSDSPSLVPNAALEDLQAKVGEIKDIAFGDFEFERSSVQERINWPSYSSEYFIQPTLSSELDKAWAPFSTEAFNVSQTTSTLMSSPPHPPNVPRDFFSSDTFILSKPPPPPPKVPHPSQRDVSSSDFFSSHRPLPKNTTSQPNPNTSDAFFLPNARSFSTSLEFSSDDESSLLRSFSRSPKPKTDGGGAITRSISKSPQQSQSSTSASDAFTIRNMRSFSKSPTQSQSSTLVSDAFTISNMRSFSKSPQQSQSSISVSDAFTISNMRSFSKSPQQSQSSSSVNDAFVISSMRSFSKSPQQSQSSTSTYDAPTTRRMRSVSKSPPHRQLSTSTSDAFVTQKIRSVSKSPPHNQSSTSASDSFVNHKMRSVSKSPPQRQSSASANDAFAIGNLPSLSKSPKHSISSTVRSDALTFSQMRPASQSPPHNITRLDLSREENDEISKILTKPISSASHRRVSLSPKKLIQPKVIQTSDDSATTCTNSQPTVPSPARLSPTIVSAFEDCNVMAKDQAGKKIVRRVTFENQVQIRAINYDDSWLTEEAQNIKTNESSRKKSSKLSKLKGKVSNFFRPRPINMR